MNLIKQKELKIIPLSISVLVLSLLLVYFIYATWTPPAQPPAGGNVATPLNVGPDDQVKIGGLRVDSPTLVVDDANNRVGIGTVSPASPLHVMNLPIFADNAAAILGGLSVGAFYLTPDGMASGVRLGHTLTVNSSGIADVVITGAEAGHGGTTNYARVLLAGTSVSLTAPASSGTGNFANWTGCDGVGGTGNRTCTLTLNANRTVTANYIIPLTLTVNSVGALGVTITGADPAHGGQTNYSRSINAGTAVSLTAPHITNLVTLWTECDSISGANNLTCNLTMNASRTVTVTYTQPTSVNTIPPNNGVIVFVTSVYTSGNIGGVSGAHQRCQNDATTFGLGGFSWRAWISSTAADAPINSHTRHNRPYYKFIGGEGPVFWTRVANNWSDLVDGNIMTTINTSLAGVTYSGMTLTSTSELGNYISGQDCSNWTSTGTSSPREGDSRKFNLEWTNQTSLSGHACGHSFRLYCFQQ